MQKQVITQQESSPLVLSLQQEITILTEQIKLLLSGDQADLPLLNQKIKVLIRQQTKFHNIKQLYLEQSNQNSSEQQSDKKAKEELLQSNIQMIEKQAEEYVPTEQQIQEKRNLFIEQMNDDVNENWTDATRSDAGTLGQDGMVVLDDDMLDQFLGKYNKDQDEDDEQEQQEENVDYDQLQKQFVTGEESNEDFLFGKHGDKFCVSVCSVLKEGLVVSGGGDDQLHFYKFQLSKDVKKEEEVVSKQQQPKEIEVIEISLTQKQQETKNVEESQSEGTEITEKQQQQQHLTQQPPKNSFKKRPQPTKQTTLIQPFKTIPHTQTINLIDVSFDKQLIFSLTEKELFYTNTKTLQTLALQIQTPTQLTCHQQGGVFAIANAFNVEIFNIKGMKFYDSFCLDQEVNLLKWTLNGKQLVAACDNKLRIITPKTQEVTKASGMKFHQGEITTMSLLENVVFTGCIDGYVFATSLAKGTVMTGTACLQATINTLCAAQNYLIVGPATNSIYWFDSNKMKQLFTNQLKGSSTDIIQLRTKNQYAVGDIQGEIHLFDRRSPMEEKFLLKAGNTVHKLWSEDNLLLAACEDGCVRGWDLRKCQY